MCHRSDADPEFGNLRELLGAKLARLLTCAPGGWRTLHESELDALGVAVSARKAVLALQSLTSSMLPTLPRQALVSADDVARVYSARLGCLRHEVMLAVALDGRNHVLEELTLAQGGAHGCAIAVRDVFRPLIRVGASGCVLVHNHPSGDPKPSCEDIEMTQIALEAGSVVGVPILDHIIVGANGGGWSSLFELGVVKGISQ